MMEYRFRDILERDIDMLILEEFACSKSFSDIFLSKIGIKDAKLISTWQSKTDSELGESDITVIFNCNNKRIALLIENKIDAIAMPEQPSRYVLRGNKGIVDGEFDCFNVFIVAPRQYLEQNEKAKEYPNKISYEEIKKYFEEQNDDRATFKLALINLAIEKQKKGYQVVSNALVTEFWRQYIDYKNLYFPNLNLIINNEIKPTYGIWTCFKTNDGNLIYHKSDKGYVDLTYKGCADKIDTIKQFVIEAIGNFYEQGFSVVKTGKSCAIRISVPKTDFKKSFAEQIIAVKNTFEAVEKLSVLSEKLDISDIRNALLLS